MDYVDFPPCTVLSLCSQISGRTNQLVAEIKCPACLFNLNAQSAMQKWNKVIKPFSKIERLVKLKIWFFNYLSK